MKNGSIDITSYDYMTIKYKRHRQKEQSEIQPALSHRLSEETLSPRSRVHIGEPTSLLAKSREKSRLSGQTDSN